MSRVVIEGKIVEAGESMDHRDNVLMVWNIERDSPQSGKHHEVNYVYFGGEDGQKLKAAFPEGAGGSMEWKDKRCNVIKLDQLRGRKFTVIIE